MRRAHIFLRESFAPPNNFILTNRLFPQIITVRLYRLSGRLCQ